jgi:hypothetical protein
LGEGLLPVCGDLPFDESAFGFSFRFRGSSFFLGSVSGAFVFGVADGWPEQFHDRVIIGGMSSIVDDLE